MKTQPIVTVSPDPSLYTEPVEIIISKLPSKVPVTLQAMLKDVNNQPWFFSEAIFQTNDEGIINLQIQAPISGSYRGIDPMGLFWSMLPVDTTEVFNTVKGNELDMFLSVNLDNEIIAQKTIRRFFASPNIETIAIREQGIVGILSYPKEAKNLPGIITLSGSGGGMSKDMAQLLASYGYTVLALGYFGVDGRPDRLENIHLEYFQKAIQWFKNLSQVNEKKVALRGASYGGELVLLLATMFPDEINAVVALTPASMIYGGFPYSNKSAWIYKNEAITPFLGGLENDDINLTEEKDLLYATKNGIIPFHKGTYEDPYEITPLFLERIKKYNSIIEEATIPVEKIRCPLLIISGEADTLHPATMYGQLIMERLEKYGSPIQRKHLHFPDAGHSPRTPYEPKVDLPWRLADNVWCCSGGTREGNAFAAKESWSEMLNFLKQALG